VIGLTFGDTLRLTQWQHIVLTLNMGLSCWMITKRTSLQVHAFAFTIYLALLWTAFAGAQIGIDVRTTWNVLPQLTPYTGQAFLSELAFMNYLKLQPPLWGWFLSRLPSYALHQVLAICMGACLRMLVVIRHDVRTAWIVAAAPLFQLLIMQPSNDLYAIVFLFAGVVSYEQGFRVLGVVLAILSTYWKYTVYAALPFLFPIFRFDMAWIIGGIVGYWVWGASTKLLWHSQQIQHYTHIFTMNVASAKTVQHVIHRSRPWYWPIRKGWRTGLWRWRHLALPAISALWWYVLPWGTLLTWRMAGFATCVILGYGNVKYLTLCLIFLPKKENYDS
jgi:hypothetical protein